MEQRVDQRRCYKRISPRTHAFFASMDWLNRANVKISYRQVLEIIWSFSMMRSQSDSKDCCELEFVTICDWYNFSREIILNKFESRMKMGVQAGLLRLTRFYPVEKEKQTGEDIWQEMFGKVNQIK